MSPRISCRTTACRARCAIRFPAEKLGTQESFVGGFVVAGRQPAPRPIFGPFEVDRGLKTVMRSSAEFQPTQGAHIRQSELCATCHTLITKALSPQGQVIGELPEQVMYQEWQHSAYPAEQRSCQSCHMPAVEQAMPISSVLGQPREGFARHVFVGGNFFMLRVFNRYRLELGVEALPLELDASAARTVRNLQSQTATVSVDRAEMENGRLNIDVTVQDLTGHKFPTGYPARRAWLHVTVRERSGRSVFESGAITPSGLIQGNDADADPTKFEPHYAEIRQPDQVQIYESVMGDPAGLPTTGLLTAVRYLKDNRLLPRGFDKATADDWVKVVGGAAQDTDFIAGGDRVRYSVDTANSQGPFQIDVELRFQPIAFRWAQNLKPYDAVETRRWVAYYDSMSSGASEAIAQVQGHEQVRGKSSAASAELLDEVSERIGVRPLLTPASSPPGSAECPRSRTVCHGPHSARAGPRTTPDGWRRSRGGRVGRPARRRIARGTRSPRSRATRPSRDRTDE